MAPHDTDKHPLAYLLVYGFAAVALSCSSVASFAAYKLLFASKLAASIAFTLVMGQFYKIADGIKGINRTVGDGSLSVDKRLLAAPTKPPSSVRLVVISDTHNFNPVSLPQGDVLVHCGDFTLKGSSREIFEFCDWLEAQNFEHKVVIAGNHDMGLEFLSTEEQKAARQRLESICTLLENSGAVVAGLQFWGSPHTPYISKKRRMGFQDASENLAKFWQQIPEKVDVLMTHGPPKGYGDRILLGANVGCPELLRRVREINCRYHVFGHIHEAYGTYPSEDGSCLFINAAICNTLYNPIHAPIVLDVQLYNFTRNTLDYCTSPRNSGSWR